MTVIADFGVNANAVDVLAIGKTIKRKTVVTK
jgi:hypothetical protein